ncbi:MAG TPA: hypothetical protein VFY40_16840 [Blastocatellia bacterium]|nr:hypothetical protein [Blastocatellia bacterium]
MRGPGRYPATFRGRQAATRAVGGFPKSKYEQASVLRSSFYIGYCQQGWSEVLSRAVIDSLIHTATKNKHTWVWKYIDANIGCRIEPALIPETT